MRVTRSASEGIAVSADQSQSNAHDSTEPQTEKISKKLIIFPLLGHKNGAETLAQSKVIYLKHPRQDTIVPFLLIPTADSGQGRQQLMELNQYDEPCRSWFIGDFVVEDGSFQIATPVCPLFLAVPYLTIAQQSYQPLDQILVDPPSTGPEPPRATGISNLIAIPELTRLVKLVCDVKNISACSGEEEANIYVYRLNDAKLERWLTGRLDRLLAAMRDDLGQSGIGDLGTARRYCFGLLADYLPAHLEAILKESLGIEDVKCSDTPNTVMGEDKELVTEKPELGIELPDAKRAKRSPLKPSEDYYDQNLMLAMKRAASAGADSSKLTVAQKQLRKASSGTKALSSFFKKK